MPANKRRDDTIIRYITVSYRSVLLTILAVVMIVAVVSYFLVPSFAQKVNDFASRLAPKTTPTATASATGPQQAHFTNIDGTVKVKKASTGNWIAAEYDTPLDKGDVIQTGSEGIARVVFADGTNYTLKSDSLIVVQENSLNAAQQTQVAVQVTTGTVDLATSTFSQGSKSQVIVAGATATLQPESAALVSNDPRADKTEFTVKKGGADVNRNGEVVTLAALDKVSFKSTSDKMAKERMLPPPTLINPANMLPVFASGGTNQIEFSWTPIDGVKAYRIRLSKNPYFTQVLLDKKVNSAEMTLAGVGEGSYYWAVQSVDARGKESIESERNKFTVVPHGTSSSIALELEPFVQHGHVLEVKGKTEPTARVLVNGEEVPVIGGDGIFRYYTPPLPGGENVITITAQNSKGGVNTLTKKVTIQ